MDRRRLPLLISAVALLIAPAAASAQFAETPPLTLTGERSCLAPTGTPGEVTAGTSTGVRFLHATRTGLAPAGEVKMGEGFSCSAVSTRGTGAGVIAGTVDFGDSVAAAVRDPGGAWSEALPVAPRRGFEPALVVASVSERGDAVVAWAELRLQPEPEIRIRAARRAPGAAFGPAVVLHSSDDQIPVGLSTGIAADGEAIVTFNVADTSAKGPPRGELKYAIGGLDGGFAPAATVGTTAVNATASLSVAADGRALVSFVRDGFVHFAERAPGAAFGTANKLASAGDPSGLLTIAKLADTGAAAIAWSGNTLARARVAVRPGLGGFRPAVVVGDRLLLPSWLDPFYFSAAFAQLAGGASGSEMPTLAPDALTLTADGRALVSTTPTQTATGVTAAKLASVPLTGGAPTVAAAGGQFGRPSAALPLLLADGAPALLWVDREERTRHTVHLATAGAIRPAPAAAPTVRVRQPTRRTLGITDSLSLPVSCSGPCVVRGQIAGDQGSDGTLMLERKGTGTLRIAPGILPTSMLGSPVRVEIRYGAPDALTPAKQSLTVRLQPRDAPLPRIVGLRATRSGDTIRVSWRVTHPGSFAVYFVSGSQARDDRGEPSVVVPEASENKRKTFRATLRPTEPVRYVTVRMIGDVGLPLRETVKIG